MLYVSSVKSLHRTNDFVTIPLVSLNAIEILQKKQHHSPKDRFIRYRIIGNRVAKNKGTRIALGILYLFPLMIALFR